MQVVWRAELMLLRRAINPIIRLKPFLNVADNYDDNYSAK